MLNPNPNNPTNPQKSELKQPVKLKLKFNQKNACNEFQSEM